MVRLFGRVPLMLAPLDQSNSENLIRSVLIPQSSIDSVYLTILNDLWFARNTVGNVSDKPNDKFTVSKGVVNALLAKVYASKSPANWDSVAYYCDRTIPDYTMLSDYTFLWDNNHKNNSEAIWELNYVGYGTGDQIGNWIPSQFIGSGWKKFETPTNDLVNAFRTEGDSVRLHASITFVNYGWSGDPYWHDPNNFPVLTKYNDPNSGVNDFYLLRLPDILLLRAEAYVAKGDVSNAATLVDQVRARVGLSHTSAATASDMALAIEKERRLELAFEGHRWFDLLRTGRAEAVMNAQKDGNGNSLNYNIRAYQLLFPVPQTELDLNSLLQQNQGY
jgi:starch-binding outer membrane protein, SusD/RagB family